jgi:hypothetical protein
MSTGTIIALAVIAWIAWKIVKAFAGTNKRTTRTQTPTKATPSSDDDDDIREENKRHTAPGDAWEGSFWEASRATHIQRAVRFAYVDGNGERSRRDVDIRAFDAGSKTSLVIGHCRLRHATRTFRFDRMRDCIDLETGEMVSDLRTHLIALHQSSPAGSAELLASQHWDLLKIMLYIAKADGQMRAAEIKVIADHCKIITGDEKFTPDTVKAALSAIDVMTSRGFVVACNRLAKEDPTRLALCNEAAIAIVATQKTIHPQEKAALDSLEKALKAAAKSATSQTG